MSNQYEFFKKIKLTDEGHLVLSLSDNDILNIEQTIENVVKKYNTPNYSLTDSSVKVNDEIVKTIEIEKVAHYIKSISKKRTILPRIEIVVVRKIRNKRRKYLTHKEQEERYFKKIIPIKANKLLNIL